MKFKVGDKVTVNNKHLFPVKSGCYVGIVTDIEESLAYPIVVSFDDRVLVVEEVEIDMFQDPLDILKEML